MYYLLTIGYETEKIDKDGLPKIKKVKYIVEAESVEEVTLVAAKYRSGDARGSDCLSISKMPIEAVIDPTSNPECYKTK